MRRRTRGVGRWNAELLFESSAVTAWAARFFIAADEQFAVFRARPAEVFIERHRVVSGTRAQIL